MSPFRPKAEEEEEVVGGWAGGGLSALGCLFAHLPAVCRIDLNKPLPGCFSLLETPPCLTAQDFVVLFDCIAV